MLSRRVWVCAEELGDFGMREHTALSHSCRVHLWHQPVYGCVCINSLVTEPSCAGPVSHVLNEVIALVLAHGACCSAMSIKSERVLNHFL